MRPAVLAAFVDHTIPLEGVCYCLYADVKSLVTTAIGLLVDPVSMALGLPLKHPDGRPATRAEIASEWQRVKDGSCGSYPSCTWGTSRTCFAHLGWRAADKATKLRLTRADVDKLTQDKMRTMWRVIASRWPNADSWPCDAQMAVLSWAWGVGPHARWPMFDAALRAGDFAVAALHVQMKGAGTIPKRNKGNQVMLRNAAIVQRTALDPEVLYYPRALSDETPTLPALPDLSEPDDEPTVTENVTPMTRGEMAEAIVDSWLEAAKKPKG
jgi:hypothetical protein